MTAAYAALGTSYATLARFRARAAVYALKLDACLALVDAYRREHPGGGLVKIYRYLRYGLGEPLVDGLSRERFVAGMQARGRVTELRPPVPRTTQAGGSRFANLTRGLVVAAPDRVWCSDTTYYRMADGAWAYITFVLDVFTREILGWAVARSLDAEANRVALRAAIATRGGAAHLGALPIGVVFHSDGGRQYAEAKFVAVLATVGGRSSMGFVAQENAFAERINGIIKHEFLGHWTESRLSVTKLELCTARAVATYNETRFHDGLPPNLSPAAFAAEYAAGGHLGYSVEIQEWNHDPYHPTDTFTDTTPQT